MPDQIDLARRHVAEAHSRLAKQRELIDLLNARGQPTDLAEDLLSCMEETTRHMELHLDRMETELRPK